MKDADRHRRAATLARWLGPWAGAAAPEVARVEQRLASPSGPVRAYLYEPLAPAPTGAILVVPGLHPSGPDDPRLDRFCRILAAAGLVVLAPFVRPHLALVVSRDSADDVALALEALALLARLRRLPRPAMMSISFGSLPALTVAARPSHATMLGGLVLFGGYRDFEATIRFTMTGRAEDRGRPLTLPHDPLNAPALFVNLLPLLEVEGPREPLLEAWHEMARRTWGRPELRPANARRPIADEVAATLLPSQRALFLVGCGLAPGGTRLLDRALSNAGEAFAFADPGPCLRELAAPVLIAHGRDDDVIPWVEARKLADELPRGHRASLAITGLFGHTGATTPSVRAVAAELACLRTLMYGLVDAPHEALGR